MKRIVLLVLLSLLAVPESHAAGGFLKSLALAQKQAKQKNQLIFVDLFAEWCGWCHRMEKEVFPSEAFQKATDDMVLLRLDTEDRAEGTRFAQKYQVTQLPTFMVLTPDLTVAGVIRGYAPSQQFADKVRGVVKEHDAFKSRVAKEASIANDPRKRLDLAIEFTNRYAYPDAESRLVKLTSEKSTPQPVRDEAFYYLAVSQFSQDKYAETLATIGRAGSSKSKSEWVERTVFLTGHVYLEQGKLREAIAEFKKFKSSYPASALNRQADYLVPQIESALARAQ